jgi:hypothetical protein
LQGDDGNGVGDKTLKKRRHGKFGHLVAIG